MRSRCVLMLCAISLVCAGCWSFVEPVDLTVASAFAVDSAENTQVTLCVELVNPETVAGNGGAPEHPTRVLCATAHTVFESLRSLALTEGKRVFLGNSDVLVIGRELAATRGVSPALDFVKRQRELRRTLLLVLGDADVSTLLATRTLRDTAAEEMQGLLQLGNITGFVTSMTAREFMLDMALPGIHPVLPVCGLDIPQQAETEQSEQEQESGSHLALRMDRMALFRDDRLQTILSADESRGLLWLRGALKGTALGIPLTEQDWLTVMVVSADAKIKPNTAGNGLPTFEILIDIVAELADAHTQTNAALANADLHSLERRIAEFVTQEASNTMRLLQEVYHLDSIGLGLVVYRLEPDIWQTSGAAWHDVFQTVKWQIHTTVSIRSTGAVQER